MIADAEQRLAANALAARAIGREVLDARVTEDAPHGVLSLSGGPLGITEAAIVHIAGELAARGRVGLADTPVGRMCLAAIAALGVAPESALAWFARCQDEAEMILSRADSNEFKTLISKE